MTEISSEDKWDIRFLRLAEHISLWSKDPSTKVGVVIVDPDKRIVSIGYNGFPKGVEDTDERLNNRDLKYKIVVHGERNALLFATQSVKGCTIYFWPFLSCAPCTSMVIQSGITRAVTLVNENPRWVDDFKLSRQLYLEAGVELKEMVL